MAKRQRSTSRTAPARSGLGPSRLAQLRRDLALTPEERVRAAEETLRLTELRTAHGVHQIVGFDSYEEFLDWKRQRELRG